MGCVFCEIIAGRAEAACVHESPATLAFLDNRPLFPGHVLVVPKRHAVTMPDLQPAEVTQVFEAARLLAGSVPRACGAKGTFVAVNNTVSQTVFHLHVHVVPRTKGDGLKGFFWPRNPYRDAAHLEEIRAAIARVALQEEVLDCWFGPEPIPAERKRLWFAQDAAFDEAIRQRFEGRLEQALRGALAWEDEPRGRLALVILLDQFSRNLYRHTARAFAADELAVRLVLEGLELGHDQQFTPDERSFFYLPLEHAEDRALQARSVELFEALGDPLTLDYAVRHRQIIERFGRFPHRNAALGRESTAEERVFLEEPGSSFW